MPLCGRAIEILREGLGSQRRNRLVCPSRRGKTLSERTLSKLVKVLGIGAVPHGFRSSCRDWAAELTDHPREVALAHVVSNKVGATRARSDLFERRRRLLDDWAAYFGLQRAEAN